jgi:hypothetical protein
LISWLGWKKIKVSVWHPPSAVRPVRSLSLHVLIHHKKIPIITGNIFIFG